VKRRDFITLLGAPVQAMRRIISRCMTSCGGSASSRATLIIRVPLAAKLRLSRSSRPSTHTRLIQARLRAARSSPPRPLWFCIVDMRSPGFSEGLPHHTQPLAIGFEAAFLQNSPTCKRVLHGRKKRHAHWQLRLRSYGISRSNRTLRKGATCALAYAGRGIRCRNAMRFWTFRRTCLAANER
jgi:hypothetical protein